MRTEEILRILEGKRNGAWFTAVFKTDLPINANAKKEGVTGYKLVTAQCRKGIHYTNIKTVQEKHGINYKAEKLPWGNWKVGNEGIIIENKGKEYLRLYYGVNTPKVKYILNNKEVTKEELFEMGVLQPSFFTNKTKAHEVLTLKVENVLDIK